MLTLDATLLVLRFVGIKGQGFLVPRSINQITLLPAPPPQPRKRAGAGGGSGPPWASLITSEASQDMWAASSHTPPSFPLTGTPKLRAGSPVTDSLRTKDRQGIIGSGLANGFFLPRAGHGSSANIRQASPGQLVTGMQAAYPHLPTHGPASSS